MVTGMTMIVIKIEGTERGKAKENCGEEHDNQSQRGMKNKTPKSDSCG